MVKVACAVLVSRDGRQASSNNTGEELLHASSDLPNITQTVYFVRKTAVTGYVVGM